MKNSRTKRIIAGALAMVMVITSITITHISSARAADLTFVKTKSVPVASGEDLGEPIALPYYQPNFYNASGIDGNYYYAGLPFVMLRTEGADNSIYLMLSKEAVGTSAWSDSADNNVSELMGEVENAVNASDAEKSAIIEQLIDVNKDVDEGYTSSLPGAEPLGEKIGTYPATSHLFYPLAVSDVFYGKETGDYARYTADPRILSVQATEFWTRTTHSDKVAYYINETGDLIPASDASAPLEPNVSEGRGIVPAFRLNTKDLVAQLPANETEPIPSPDFTAYEKDPGDSDTWNYRYLVIDDTENELESSIANKVLGNVIEKSSLLVDYKVKKDASKYITAIICEKTGEIKYIARLTEADATKGKVLLNIPAGLTVGKEYYLGLFEETYTGVNNTETCSTPVYAKFTLRPESEKETDTVEQLATPEHMENILQDTDGETTYYFGGKEFVYAKTNNNKSLMLIAKKADDWGTEKAWDEETITAELESNAAAIFSVAEKAAIKPVDVLFTKYENDSTKEKSLMLYPVTKTIKEDASIASVKFVRDYPYWTASYKNASKAYYIEETTGNLEVGNKNMPLYVLPAVNINPAQVVAEDLCNGENNANMSVASEPHPYNTNEHSRGLRFILKDDTANSLNIANTEITAQEGATVNDISYTGANIMYTTTDFAVTGAHYLNAIIYEKDKDDILYMGRIKRMTTDENAGILFKMPAGLSAGVYDIAFVEETVTANGLSSTCSSPELNKITLTVTPKADEKEDYSASTKENTDFNTPDQEGSMSETAQMLAGFYQEGDEITFNTTENEEKIFIVYNTPGATDRDLYALVENAEAESAWGEGKNGQQIINAADEIAEGLEAVEKQSLVSKEVNTKDKNPAGLGSGTKKLFAPSVSELDTGTGTVKKDILDRTKAGESNDFYWTRSFAGGGNTNANAYYITNNYYINGITDENNVAWTNKVIPSGYLNLANAAIFVGDAEEGEYNDVGPELTGYDWESYGGNGKPYYVAERLHLSMPGLNQTTLENAQPGVTYKLSYEDADYGSNMYLSAVIYKIKKENNETNVDYYGRLKRLSAATGEVSIKLPTGLQPDDEYKYVLAFFAEEANAPYKFNYTSEPIYVEFEVKEERSLEFCDIFVSDTEYTGSPITPTVRVEDQDTHEVIDPSLYEATYYTSAECIEKADIDGETVTEPGTYYAKISATEGIDNDYYGFGVKKFQVSTPIGDERFGGVEIVLTPSEYMYTGEAKEPNVTVLHSDDLSTMDSEEGYTVSYENNVNAGTASVIITGKNAYNSTMTAPFVIHKAEHALVVENIEKIYDGLPSAIEVVPQEAEVVAGLATGETDITYTIGTEEFESATDAGEYAVHWKLTSKNYVDKEGDNTIVIAPRDASGATVTLEKTTYPYSGGNIIPVITAASVDGVVITALDYDIEWDDNKNPGEAKGVMTFKRNFTGSKNLTFNIIPLDLTALDISGENPEIYAPDKTYTGTPITPEVLLNGVDITQSSDFNVTYRKDGEEIAEIIDAGNYTILITPKNTEVITGSKEIPFKVKPIVMDESNTEIVADASVKYAGEPITDTLKKVYYVSSSGSLELVEGRDYTKAYSNNTAPGTGHVTITFINNYTSAEPLVVDFEIKAGTIEMGTVTDIDTIYDGTQHKPEVECLSPEDVTIKYAIRILGEGIEEGVQPAESAFSTTIPTTQLVNVGAYEVWYQVSKQNYGTLTNYTGVRISPASMEEDIQITNMDISYDEGRHPFTAGNITLTGKAAGAVMTYSASEDGEYTATIPQFESEGNYTDPRLYEVYCRFTKPNYLTVTRKATVNIRKVPVPYTIEGSGEILYDGLPHTIVCTPLKPGATVQYAEARNVDNKHYGPLSPEYVNEGSYRTYVLIQLEGYEDTEFIVQTIIKPIDMDVTVTGYSGPYDRVGHSMEFDFSKLKPAANQAHITYSEDGELYTDEKPFKTNANTYKVYYKIEAPNYNTKTGWVNINITALDTAAEATGYDGPWDNKDHSPKVTVSVPEDNYTVTYSTDEGVNWTLNVPKYKNPGTYNVMWKVEENDGNYKTVTGTVAIKIGPKTFVPINMADLDPNKPLDDAIRELLEGEEIGTIEIGPDVGPGITGKAFKDNDKIKNIRVDENNPYYSSRNGVLYDKTGETLIAVPKGKNLDSDTIAQILAGVTVIGESAFEGRDDLTGMLNIPEGVTIIGKDAFRGTGISGVVVPTTCRKIETGAFADTRNLRIANIKGDPVVEAGTFTGSGLNSVVYANNGKTIVYVPSSVQVEGGIFYVDSNEVTDIAGGAFKDNDRINTIMITGKNLVTIGKDAIRGDVAIKVPKSMVTNMTRENPEYDDQIIGYTTSLENAVIDLNEEGRTYKIGKDGTMPTPEVKVYVNGLQLVEGTDFIRDYTYDLSKGTITITGKGDYSGTATKVFPFAKTGQLIVDMNSSMKNNEFVDKNQNGTSVFSQKTAIESNLRDSAPDAIKNLAETKNIVIKMVYSENIDAEDRAKIIEYAAENEYDGIAKIFDLKVYTEDEDGNIELVPELAAPVAFTTDVPDQYRNKEGYGVVRVHNGDAAEIESKLKNGNKQVGFESSEFSTYALVYANGAPDASLFTATIPSNQYPYTGASITPTVTVKYADVPLTLGTDYIVSYSNNVEQGMALITVTGVGNYAGIEKTLNFAIVNGGGGGGSGDIANVVSALSGSNYYQYTGEPIKPAVIVTDNGMILAKGIDYQLFYQNNINAGTGKVIVSGLNDYALYRNELMFEIEPKSIASADIKVTGIEDEKVIGDSSSVTQSPTLRYNNKTLKKGTDYRLTYTNNKKAGTATMTISGINNFAGYLDYDFDIIEDKDKNKKDSGSSGSGSGSASGSSNSLSSLKLDKDGRIPVSVSGNVVMPSALASKTAAGTKGALSPQTGDTTTVPVRLGLIFAMLGGGGAGYVAYKRKKKVNS